MSATIHKHSPIIHHRSRAGVGSGEVHVTCICGGFEHVPDNPADSWWDAWANHINRQEN